MSLVGRAMFSLVNWRARRGIAADGADGRVTGVRGETCAYWYLRRHGYVMIARNYRVPGLRGEIDLIGYDRGELVFVEVKTRTGRDSQPEDAITPEKRHVLIRMAQAFLADRRIKDAAWRFDVVAILGRAGRAPEIRLHKNAFGASG